MSNPLRTESSQAALPAGVRVRAATVRDIPAIERFIAQFTTDGTLLPRTRANLLAHVRDFRVARASGEMIGCGALQVVNGRLAEVRSIAVHPAWRGGGIGSHIVSALIEDAERLGVTQVFCLTRRQSFFARLGFHPVPKEDFPHKIWNDCRVCPRLQSCDEIAMQRTVRPVTSAGSRREAAVRPMEPTAADPTGTAAEVLSPARHGGVIDVRRRDLEPEPPAATVRFVPFPARPDRSHGGS